MKKFIIIIAILLLISVPLGLWYGKKSYDKITFTKPSLNQDIQAILQTNVSDDTISVPLPFNINNENNFPVEFSSINAQLLYSGELIGESNDAGWHTIPKNGTLPYAPVVNITINDAVKSLLAQKIKGVHPSLDYVINLKVFGVPIPSVKGTLTW